MVIGQKENSSLVQIYCDDDDSFTKIKKLYSARFPNFIGAKSPKRHNDFVYKYDGFYLYADILSCLYDLYLSYIKAVARTTEEVVAEEDGNKPFTDDQMVQVLMRKNAKIARRTITKYRKELNIPPASKRKKIFD